MAVPAAQIIQVCQIMGAFYAEGRKSTADAKRAEFEVHIRSLELAAEREKVQAQKEILLRLVAVTQHVFDRKMDFFQEAFRSFHALIAQHQTALIEEQRALQERQFADGLSDLQFAQIMQRKAQISVELIDLKKISAVVSRELSGIVHGLSADLTTHALPGRYEL